MISNRNLVPWICAISLFCCGQRAIAENHSAEEFGKKGLDALHSGKLKEAEKYFDQAMTEAGGAQGSTAGLATALNNMALLRLEQGKFTDSEVLFLRATDLLDKLYSGDNPDLASMLENTGTAFLRHGKLDSAEPWLKRAMVSYERSASRDETDFVGSILTLADLYYQQEKYDLAEPLYQRAYFICTKSSGSGVDTKTSAIAVDRLALFYQSQGKYKDAQTLFDRAMEICSKLNASDSMRLKIQEHRQELMKAKERPNVTILRPKDGEIFYDEPIFVKLAVDNFKLELPELHFGDPSPEQKGHIHIMFDSYPLVATTSTQQMFGKALGTDTYLPKGKHTITVELVHDTHNGITPPVKRTVIFYTDHADQAKPTGGKE